MNIIKVIVSDLPPYCSECYFETYEGECGAMLEFANTPREIDTEDGGFESRPDWCPLTTEAEYLEGLAEEFERDSNYVEPRPEIAQFGESEE